MALTTKQRRALLAGSHRLKATVAIAAGEVSDAVVAHVRAGLAGRELLKLRIHANSGSECDAAAEELARRVPCEVVKRIGRVVLLYWQDPGPRSDEATARPGNNLRS